MIQRELCYRLYISKLLWAWSVSSSPNKLDIEVAENLDDKQQ